MNFFKIQTVIITLTLVAFSFLFIVPQVLDAHAGWFPGNGSIHTCTGVGGAYNYNDHTGVCTYDAFIHMMQHIMSGLFFLSIPIATLVIAYAGFLMIVAAGNESQISKAKGIFTKVVIGFIFILSAWLIVYTITSVLLVEKYQVLKAK